METFKIDNYIHQAVKCKLGMNRAMLSVHVVAKIDEKHSNWVHELVNYKYPTYKLINR